MRFLPVFLDLQAGCVVLVGGDELVRAKLRVLSAAGARIRWFATDGNWDVGGLDADSVARIAFADGDPLTVDLQGVIAVMCAGAGDVGVAMSARAQAAGLPVNVMDDLAHSTFISPAIVDRGDVVIAIGTGGASPVVARRLRERIEAVLPARIGDLATFIGRFRKSVNDRIAEMPLRRRFWERVVDGPIGAMVLAGRDSEAERALSDIADPMAFAGASGGAEGRVTLVGAGPGRSGSADDQGAARAAGRRCGILRRTGLTGGSRSRTARCGARSGRPPRRQARHRPGCHQPTAGRSRQIRPSARCG